jgi:hypothetical protein
MDEKEKKQILKKIISSSYGEWEKSSYSDHPYVGYPKIAFYKPDTSIVLAWEYEVDNDFKAPWANKFPEPKAWSCYVAVFCNNILLERFLYVEVDGGRAMLPLIGSLKTKLITYYEYSCLIRLLDQIHFGSGSQYESYFKWAGLEIPINGNLLS